MGVYFSGDEPSIGGTNVFYASSPTVYYTAGTAGWHDTFAGRPTEVWEQAEPSTPEITARLFRVSSFNEVIITGISTDGLVT